LIHFQDMLMIIKRSRFKKQITWFCVWKICKYNAIMFFYKLYEFLLNCQTNHKGTKTTLAVCSMINTFQQGVMRITTSLNPWVLAPKLLQHHADVKYIRQYYFMRYNLKIFTRIFSTWNRQKIRIISLSRITTLLTAYNKECIRGRVTQIHVELVLLESILFFRIGLEYFTWVIFDSTRRTSRLPAPWMLEARVFLR